VKRRSGGAGAEAVQLDAPPPEKPKKLERDFLKVTPTPKKQIGFLLRGQLVICMYYPNTTYV